MNNCLILGSGRSGTSMMGGILNDAGYFLGEDLYPGRDSNPKGFFENAEINGINEEILQHYDSTLGKLKRFVIKKSTIKAPSYGQRWLSSIPLNTTVDYKNEDIIKRIENAIKQQPFGYKDPRFSYTLPVWKRFLPEDTKIIVMFRAPDVTANSIVKECSTTKYLQNLEMNYKLALQSWMTIYAHVLKNYEKDKENFLFVHYDQIYLGEGLNKLSEFLEITLNSQFVEKSLKRSMNSGELPVDVKDMYNKLCSLAGYKND